ncbi:MAG: T9SS type A sorting domain-containing protein [Bacteroidia bacterium]|nr:T9SS type A sorting domain-containing protein [Bacteroidia bacterium]
MNKVYAACFLFLLSSFPASAQQAYSGLFLQQAQYFYAGQNSISPFITYSPVQVLHFDALLPSPAKVKYQGFRSPNDTVLTPTACMWSDGESWFSSEALLMQNGREVYFNAAHDSIFVEPGAITGKTWRMYNYLNGDYVEAKVTALFPFPLFSALDSVKVISLERKDNAANMVLDPVNTIQLRVSRDSGWVSFVDCRHFPSQLIPMERIPWFNLPLRSEIFDFQPGDIFQYEQVTTNFMSQPLQPLLEEIQVLSRQDFMPGDSVEYTCLKQTMEIVFNTSPTPHFDTLRGSTLISETFHNLSSPLWQGWPGQSLYTGNEVSSYTLDTGSCQHRKEVSLSTGYFLYDTSASCYRIPFESQVNTETYSVGRGLTLKSANAFSMGGAHIRKKQVWYRKGTETCGDPIVFTGISNEEAIRPLRIFPNPAQESLFIEFPATPGHRAMITLTDVLGRSIHLDWQESGAGFFSELSALPSGLYAVCIRSKTAVAAGTFIRL